MLFQTERLLIRQLNETDFPAFHEMESNPDVLKYTGSPLKTKEEIAENLKELIRKYEDPKNDFWIWAVVHKESNAFLGTCAIIEDLPPFGREIGYRFLERHWGKGYAGETMIGLVDYAFNVLSFEKIYADVDVLNTPSVKILEKHMHFHSEYFVPEENCTDRKYTLTSEQWKSQQKV